MLTKKETEHRRNNVEKAHEEQASIYIDLIIQQVLTH